MIAKILPFKSQKLISLRDMICICAIEAASKLAWLSIWGMDVRDKIRISGQTSVLTDDETLELIKALDSIKDFCAMFELKNSLARCEQFLFETGRKSLVVNVIESEIRGLEISINEELNNRYCAFIPVENVKYFEQDRLFGDDVWKAFPDAREEIKNAGNCLAADLNTAAVFHLMRVAEIGLQKLAKSLKVILPCQIEFATWGNVTTGISDKLQKIKSTPRTISRDKKLQYYSQLLLDIKAFQHLWRDPVSHLRGNYDGLQARSAFNHVCGFMQKVSVKHLPR
jgi:hypothetical protein